MNIAPVHPKPGNGNPGIVPPWLQHPVPVPLPGPDDEFHILPIDDGAVPVPTHLVLTRG